MMRGGDRLDAVVHPAFHFLALVDRIRYFQGREFFAQIQHDLLLTIQFAELGLDRFAFFELPPQPVDFVFQRFQIELLLDHVVASNQRI